MTTTSHVRPGPETTGSSGAGPLRVAAAALAVSAVTVAALLATTPWGNRLDSGADEVLNYDDLVQVRASAWPSAFTDAFAWAVIGVVIGLGTLHLARSRGRNVALVGAVLSTAGGILFAMGGAAFATFSWFATAPGLGKGAGRSLVDYANEHVGHVIASNIAGFILFSLGTFVLSAALIRARAVPLPAAVAFLLLTFAQFAGLPGRAMDLLQIALMVFLLGFAVVLWRRAHATAPAEVEE
jgi:hypothetical protein